jgi:hypothetical protein
MPQLPFSSSVAAGATFLPLTGWTYEFLPWPAHVRVLARATVAANMKLSVFSGSEAIQEEAPVQGGGTAGTTPSELNTPPLDFQAPAGDKLKLQFRNTDAGAQTVDGIIVVQPL